MSLLIVVPAAFFNILPSLFGSPRTNGILTKDASTRKTNDLVIHEKMSELLLKQIN